MESQFVYGIETDSTYAVLKERLEVSLKLPEQPLPIVQGHINLGEYYHKMGLHLEAMNQFNLALGKLTPQKMDSLYTRLNTNIGKVYLALNNFSLAQQYFEDIEASANERKDLKVQATALGLLGSCFEKQGIYPKALEHQEKSLNLFKRLNDAQGIAVTHENIGSIYEDLEQFDLAHAFFEKAHGYFEGSQTFAEANVLNNLGDTFRKTGHYADALKYTKKALEVAQHLNDYHLLESAHKDLSKTYALMGNFQFAHDELVQSKDYNNALLETRNFNQLNILQTIYETNKKEAEIRLLKEQNKVSTAKQNLLWVALFASATIFTILFIYWGRKRKAKIKIQEYRQRMLKAELDKKEIEEKNLQNEVQLKTASLSRYSLHLSQKNKILLDLANTLRNIVGRQHMDTNAKIKQLVKEIDFNLQQEHEWDEFMNFFREIHPEFIKKLAELSEGHLSPAELRLGMLLRLNLSSKEIASILRVTPDSVRVARYRLRKKLPIEQKEELVSFMLDL
nr:tetratricopeptide repeat protein [Allomuricauda sp.]